MTYPVQVLAAASYDSELGPPPLRGCQPRRVLDQKPFDGVLLQVVEWTRSPQRDIGDFPLRKRPFRLPTRALSKRFECVGTYDIAFRDRRRAFQAFVWLDPTHVEPRLRSQAIDLLSSIRFRDR